MEINESKHQEILDRLFYQKNTMRRLWNVGNETLKYLELLVRIIKPQSLLEIGTSNGFSAFHFYLYTQKLGTRIETIECDEKRYLMAKDNLGGLDRLTLHYGKAEDIIPTLNKKYDFVFIDANKSCYHHYLAMTIPLLNEGALIVADNILSHKETVEAYVKELERNCNFTSIIVPVDSGLEISVYEPQ
jgi:predicted O-methyltransferase YrrM